MAPCDNPVEQEALAFGFVDLPAVVPILLLIPFVLVLVLTSDVLQVSLGVPWSCSAQFLLIFCDSLLV